MTDANLTCGPATPEVPSTTPRINVHDLLGKQKAEMGRVIALDAMNHSQFIATSPKTRVLPSYLTSKNTRYSSNIFIKIVDENKKKK